MLHLVHTSHHQKLLDDRNKEWHRWKLLLPEGKRIIGDDSGVVLKGHIDLDRGDLVDKFDQWYLGANDDFHGALLSYTGNLDEITEAPQLFISLAYNFLARGSETIGDHDNIHIGIGEV